MLKEVIIVLLACLALASAVAWRGGWEGDELYERWGGGGGWGGAEKFGGGI